MTNLETEPNSLKFDQSKGERVNPDYFSNQPNVLPLNHVLRYDLEVVKLLTKRCTCLFNLTVLDTLKLVI